MGMLMPALFSVSRKLVLKSLFLMAFFGFLLSYTSSRAEYYDGVINDYATVCKSSVGIPFGDLLSPFPEKYKGSCKGGVFGKSNYQKFAGFEAMDYATFYADINTLRGYLRDNPDMTLDWNWDHVFCELQGTPPVGAADTCNFASMAECIECLQQQPTVSWLYDRVAQYAVDDLFPSHTGCYNPEERFVREYVTFDGALGSLDNIIENLFDRQKCKKGEFYCPADDDCIEVCPGTATECNPEIAYQQCRDRTTATPADPPMIPDDRILNVNKKCMHYYNLPSSTPTGTQIDNQSDFINIMCMLDDYTDEMDDFCGDFLTYKFKINVAVTDIARYDQYGINIAKYNKNDRGPKYDCTCPDPNDGAKRIKVINVVKCASDLSLPDPETGECPGGGGLISDFDCPGPDALPGTGDEHKPFCTLNISGLSRFILPTDTYMPLVRTQDECLYRVHNGPNQFVEVQQDYVYDPKNIYQLGNNPVFPFKGSDWLNGLGEVTSDKYLNPFNWGQRKKRQLCLNYYLREWAHFADCGQIVLKGAPDGTTESQCQWMKSYDASFHVWPRRSDESLGVDPGKSNFCQELGMFLGRPISYCPFYNNTDDYCYQEGVSNDDRDVTAEDGTDTVLRSFCPTMPQVHKLIRSAMDCTALGKTYSPDYDKCCDDVTDESTCN